jgi:hypothetical protein
MSVNAMKLALDALKLVDDAMPFLVAKVAMLELRQAIADAEQATPVAWRYKKEGGGWFVSDNEPQYVEQWNDIELALPLYTDPTQHSLAPRRKE